MANEKRLIDANPLCEFFQERYEYLRNASETQLPNGNVSIDLDLQVGAIIAKEFLDKAKQAPTVDAAPVVHGRWIIGDGDDDFDVMCPVCSWSDVFNVAGIDVVKMIADRMHYCQNCGAKMDGGKDDA